MPDRPNIVFLYSDQHRADVIGCRGNPDVKTPHIDRLSAEGVTFANCFCQSPVCVPSRMSTVTGQYVSTHLANTNRVAASIHGPAFPRMLQEAGYRTAAVGKMHFNPTYKNFGFDVMRLAEQDGDGRFDDDYHKYLAQNGVIDLLDLMDQRREYRSQAPQEYWDTFGAMVSNLPEEHHSTTWIGREAVQFIQQTEGAPFFLWTGFIKPHHPFDPPAPWHEMYDPAALTLPEGWREGVPDYDQRIDRGYFDFTRLREPALRRVMSHYYATISHLDHQIGAIIGALEAKGVLDNTVIIYSSDHGDFMGDRGRLLKGAFLFDALTRVPLIVSRPGASGGRTVSEMVEAIDLTATLLDLAGVAPDRQMQGRSFLPVLAEQPYEFRDAVFSEIGPVEMVRTATHKLIYGRERWHHRLHDLRTDPGECDNRWDDPALRDVRDDLLQRLLYWHRRQAPVAHGE